MYFNKEYCAKHHLRTFGPQDIRDMMEDREYLAQDLMKMKSVVAGILADYHVSTAQNPISVTLIMAKLTQLLNEVEP